MNSTHKIMAAASVMAIFAMAFGCVLSVHPDTDAAAGTDADPILLIPGQTWQYTPTFPAGLNPTLTVSASATAQPGPTATYAATSGYAKVVSGNKIEVTAPTGASVGKYYVTIRAVTAQPTQTTYQNVAFSIQAPLTGTGGTLYAAVGGAQDAFSVSASKAAIFSITGYGTLNGGSSKVSIGSSTGAMTVTGLVSGDIGTHTITVKAIATDNPTNECTITVTLVVKAQVAFTSSPSAGFIVQG